MSKVGGALPSWYWPAGIPRRVPVAQQPLGKLLRQRFTAAGAKPAIVSHGAVLTYSELLAQITGVAGGLQALDVKGPIAVIESDPAESLLLLFGGIFAGRQVFLPDLHDSPERIAARMAEAKVAAIVTSKGEVAAPAGIPTARKADLAGAYNEAAGPKRANETAVLLPAGRGVAAHSHFSLSAMAVSLGAFIPKLREMPLACHESQIGMWETLTGILLAFLNSMPIVFSGSGDAAAAQPPAALPQPYAILRRHEADAMLAAGRVPPPVAAAAYIFVSTGFFEPKWRKGLEHLCGHPIFPIWGQPETGPVVASHPTWMPPHGHGFPLVNVSLIPIDPGSGQVSIVPWEMLQQAEMGVESLAAMVGYAEPARNAGTKAGTALRTRQIATMDHVGVVALHHAPHAHRGGEIAAG